MHAIQNSLLVLSVVSTAPSCTAGGPAQDQQSGPVESIQQPIHTEKACAVRTLSARGAARAASRSGYGNWCGADLWGDADADRGPRNGEAPRQPLSCWDQACREHDYFFGRPWDGWYSCHAAFFGAAAAVVGTGFETECTAAADRGLCSQWESCSELVRTHESTWHWEFALPGTMSGPKFRACNDPSAQVKRCPFLEHPLPGADPVYTCGNCPGPDSISFGLPAPGCALPRSYLGLPNPPVSNKEKLSPDVEVRAQKACCWFIPESVRQTLSFCCPDDEPVWNEDAGSCEPCSPERPVLDVTAHVPSCKPRRSCRDVPAGSPDGDYLIDPNGGEDDDAFIVTCDLTRDGGGWTLIGRGEWWTSESELLPPGINAYLPQAKRDAIVQSSSRLFRVGDAAQRLFIRDANAIFGVGPIVPNTPAFHYWRTTGTALSCATDYADVVNDSMVVTTTRAMSCDPTGVGSHTCGYANGWILLHENDAFNDSGAHPCGFGVGYYPTGRALTTLWVR